MKKALPYFLFVLLPFVLPAQTKISMSDALLKGRTVLAPASLRQMQWIPGTSQFTHLVSNKFVRVNAANLAIDTLDLLAGINASLTKAGAKPLAALPGITWLSDKSLSFQTETDIFTYQLNGELTRINWFPAGAERLDIHDKTYKAAYTHDKGLWVNIGGKELGVAQSEKEGVLYGTSVHRDEFGITKGTFWSPSGRYLAFYRMDESMVTQYPIYVLDSMPAQVRNVRYPFSGSPSHHVTLGIYDTQTGQKHYLNTGEPAEQYLTNIAWTPDDKQVLIAVLNRGQNHMWLNQYDAASGQLVKTLFEESSDKWVEPEHPAEFVPGRNDQFVWQSERDGYNHLYLHDLSGKMLRQLTRGNTPVTNFYGFSANGEQCFYQTADASGLNRYLWSVNLKTGASTQLTTDAGTHNAIVSREGEWLLDVFSNATTPRTIYALPTKKPAERKIVFSAKNPLEGYELGETRLVSVPSPGGQTLNGRIILPTNFDPNRKYPVLVYLYNGPHVQLVTNSWMGAGELWMQRMAEQGCIVFSMDGRGSANRGFDFESAIFRHLGDAEIADQLAGVNYLKSQSFVDSTRLGVFGWSYGGFMSTSLMTRPEAKGVFKCAVAGGPVLDWRMYEIMYTERYMDTPQENPEGYSKNNLFNHIDNLDGRRLMIHGSSDDVVLWQHSLRYIRECVKKGKQIDYFVYPEHEHNVRGKDRVHLFEKIDLFFQDNLLRNDVKRP
ncbi:MAG: DPP IV N-terminal domain-containing protein [Saprospiraceae bacterium]|nr:DPP IV N-terminal domain-containing protein [Saprospiraceae bacterium]